MEYELGKVYGTGTEDDPLRPPLRGHKLNGDPNWGRSDIVRQCEYIDEQSGEKCGNWFYGQVHTAKFCPYHSPTTEKTQRRILKEHGQAKPARTRRANKKMRRNYAPQNKVIRPELSTQEYEALDRESEAYREFVAFRKRIKERVENMTPADIAKFDRKRNQKFGTFGTIKCSEREQLAAKLMGMGTPIVIASDVTGIPIDEILAMKEGGGTQQKFSLIESYYFGRYQMSKTLSYDIPELERHIRRLSHSDPKGAGSLRLKLIELKRDVASWMPQPETSAGYDFGEEGDATVQDMARMRFKEFMHCRAGDFQAAKMFEEKVRPIADRLQELMADNETAQFWLSRLLGLIKFQDGKGGQGEPQ